MSHAFTEDDRLYVHAWIWWVMTTRYPHRKRPPLRPYRCSRCKQIGHNAATCKKDRL